AHGRRAPVAGRGRPPGFDAGADRRPRTRRRWPGPPGPHASALGPVVADDRGHHARDQYAPVGSSRLSVRLLARRRRLAHLLEAVDHAHAFLADAVVNLPGD